MAKDKKKQLQEETPVDAAMVALELRGTILDAAPDWVDLEDLIEKVVSATQHPVSEDDVDAAVDALATTGALEVDSGAYRRPLHKVIEARIAALGAATNDGTTIESLLALNVTRRDISALTAAKLFQRRPDADGVEGKVSLIAGTPPTEKSAAVLGAEERIWQRGARAFAARTVPPAPEAFPTGLRADIFRALHHIEDWATTDDISEVLNAQREGADHVARGPLEEELNLLFNEAFIDTIAEEGGKPRTWREALPRKMARRAAILEEVLSRGAATTAELGEALGIQDVALDADLGALHDAGFVELGDDSVQLTLSEEGQPVVLRFVAGELSRSVDEPSSAAVQASIKEVATLREKQAVQKRRADDLATWLRRYGVEEETALDQIRGVVRTPTGKGAPFEFAQARTITDSEKGVILGEIIEIENDIAQVQMDLDGAKSSHNGRIKALQAQIKDLKNAAACSSRVVTIPAYRKTDWDAGKVVVHAVDDDRVLCEEALPTGAQRPIPGTEKAPEEAKPAIAAAVEKFVDKMAEKGFRVTGSKDENGIPVITATKVEKPSPRGRLITTMAALEDRVVGFLGSSGGAAQPAAIDAWCETFGVQIEAAPGQGSLTTAKAVQAALLRLRKAGRVEGPAGGWRHVTKAAALTDEPGPLADEATKMAHAAKKNGRSKAKAEATAP